MVRSPLTSGLLVALLTAGLLHAESAQGAGQITKGPWVQRVSSDSAVIRVEVAPPSPVSVDMGIGLPEGDGGHRVIESPEAKSLHSITVKGLQPGTRYPYSVRADGSSKLAAFVTAPPDEGNVPFRFLIYGDNRTDDAAHAAVVRAMVSVPSDFLVHTGDFVENGASSSQWETFFELEAPLLGARCLFSCVGNHELTDGAGIEYARFFGPTDLPPGVAAARSGSAPAATRPEHLDGTYRWGNTRFFFINGMVSYKGTVDRSWLEKALGDSDAEKGLEWRIVVVHHGPWSSGPHGGNARLHDAGIVALLKAHKVDLIISGHDHLYERGWADGLAYIVSGGGGAPVYTVKTPTPQSKKVEAVRHFVDVNMSAASLQLVATRSDGSTIERCGLNKATVGWDCDGPIVPAASGGTPPSSMSSTVSSGAPAAPSPTSRCTCDAVGATRIGTSAGTLMTAALAMFGWILRRRRASR